MKKTAFLFLVILLFSTVPPVHALDEAVLDSYLNSGSERNIKDNHPSANRQSAWGQTFNLTNSGWVTNVTFRLKDFGTPTCNLTVSIYRHNGTWGDGYPMNEAALATSDPVSCPLTASFVDYNFTFTGANQIQLVAGRNYTIALEASSGGTCDLTNYVIVAVDDTAPTKPGNAFYWDGIAGEWNGITTIDAYFMIYGEVLWGDIIQQINDAFDLFAINEYMEQITTYING